VCPTPCFDNSPPLSGPKTFSDRGLYPEFCPAPCGTWRTIYLLRPTLRLPPEGDGRAILAQFWPCFRRGLPCRPHCCGRGALLPHLFTLTPCGAVYSLWRCPATGDIAPASRPMLRSYNAAKFEPAPCPVKFGSSSLPLREERPSIRGLKSYRSKTASAVSGKRSLWPAPCPPPAPRSSRCPGSGSPACRLPCSSRASRGKGRVF